MSSNCSKSVKQYNGDAMRFSVSNGVLMINSNTLSCQFPLDTIMPMMEDAKTHGILRFMDPVYLSMGLTLFISKEDTVPLVMFLQTHTNSRVVA